MSGVLSRRGKLDTEPETQGECHGKTEADIRVPLSVSQGVPVIANKKPGQRPGTDSLLKCPGGTSSADILILDF